VFPAFSLTRQIAPASAPGSMRSWAVRMSMPRIPESFPLKALPPWLPVPEPLTPVLLLQSVSTPQALGEDSPEMQTPQLLSAPHAVVAG